MMRSGVETELRRRVLEAYQLACESYNEQKLSFLEGLLHIHSKTINSSVIQFGECLRTGNLLKACSDRIRDYHSMWSSNRQKSFNSHFLHELKRLEPNFYRQVIKRGRRMVFLEGEDVVLYRADRRGPTVILRDGFKPWHGMNYYGYRDRYSRTVNTTMGISTTKKWSFASTWGGTVYKIRFKAGAINDARLLGVDIVETNRRLKNCNCENCTRKSAGEVNFITAIPPQFIESYSVDDRMVENSSYTGRFTAPVTLPSLVSEPVARAERGAAVVSPGYKAGDTIRLGRYHCDVQLYRGAKGQVHYVFADEEAADRFIQGEALVSDRDSTKFKRPDPRRYHGLFAVRVGHDTYTRLQTKLKQLPDEVDLPAAP